MSERLLLKGGRVVDPGRAIDADLDVLLVDGEVAEVDVRVAARGAEAESETGADRGGARVIMFDG